MKFRHKDCVTCIHWSSLSTSESVDLSPPRIWSRDGRLSDCKENLLDIDSESKLLETAAPHHYALRQELRSGYLVIRPAGRDLVRLAGVIVW
jgi:hypothetical protein